MGDARNPRFDYAHNQALSSLCPAGEMRIGSQRWLQYYRHVVHGAIDDCMDKQEITDAQKSSMRDRLLENLRNGVVRTSLPAGRTKFDAQCRNAYAAVCSALERVLGKGNDDPPHAVDEYIKYVERVCEKKGRDQKFIERHTSYQRLLQVANGEIREDFFFVAFNSVIDDEGGDDVGTPPAQPAAADGPSSSSAPPVRMTPASSHKQTSTVTERAALPSPHNRTAAAEGPSGRSQFVEPLGHHMKLPASPAAQEPSTVHKPAQQKKEMPDAANDNKQDTVTAKAAQSKPPSRHRSVSKSRSQQKTPVSADKKLSGTNSEKASKHSTSSGGPSEPGTPSTPTASSAGVKRYRTRASQAAQPKRIKTGVITLDDNEDEQNFPEAANPAPAAGDQATMQEQGEPLQDEPTSKPKEEPPAEAAKHEVADGRSPPSDIDEADVRKLRASCDVLNRFIDERGLRASLFPFLVRHMIENANSDDGASETAKLRRNAEAMKAYIEHNGHQDDFVTYAFGSSGW